MFTIIKKSNSGSTRFVDNIHFNINRPDTYASYVLLKDYYTQLDDTNRNSFAFRMKMVGFSRKFLTSLLKKVGCLVCTYCERPNLVIELEGMKVSNSIKATIDHIDPLSKGGAPFDVKNITPCCGKCNSKKGDMTVEEFLPLVKHYLDVPMKDTSKFSRKYKLSEVTFN